ncbi:MAG: beta-N-acetylhexosaminidase [Deltaproteobacteria bacterium]|nr:beta-N-acetylhexosaminidase [Deltaproteobacteria bacterium]
MPYQIAGLSELQMVGQLFIIGLPGPNLDEQTVALLQEIKPGGIILFRRNVTTPDQLAGLTRGGQGIIMAETGIPALVAIDQEGGTVARLGLPFTVFPGNDVLGRQGREEAVYDYGRVSAQELRLAGINLNLAPVLDVLPDAESDLVMSRRSFGPDPELVTRLGLAAVRGHQDQGVMSCVKHFPGLGRVVKDPHHTLPTIAAPKGDLQDHDLVPFRAAVTAGAAMVMTSHTLYPALDADWPATLSERIITGLLRQDLGYDGVVITDDLEMGAMSAHFELELVVTQALRAGADILLICEHPQTIRRAFGAVLQAVRDGNLPWSTIERAVNRILSLKNGYLDPPELADQAAIRAHFEQRH